MRGDRVMAHMRAQEPGARAFAVGFVNGSAQSGYGPNAARLPIPQVS